MELGLRVGLALSALPSAHFSLPAASLGTAPDRSSRLLYISVSVSCWARVSSRRDVLYRDIGVLLTVRAACPAEFLPNRSTDRRMVTINEEFVANEQMNCTGGVQPGAPAAPPPQPPAPAVVESASSEEDGANDHPTPSAPAQPEQGKQKKSHDNHHSKNQRPKQKRPHSSAKAASKSEAVSTQPQQPSQQPSQPEPSQAVARPAANHSHSRPQDASAAAAAAAGAAGAFPHMEAVTRVLSLPVVESGVNIVSGVYSRVKNVNPVVQWSLGTAEGAVRSSLGRSLSLLGPLSGPLSVVDALLCRGLDMVEYNVPIITLPPEVLISASRDYMSMRVVAPVLRMTASNARLADTLAARALDSADHYVDKFLPGDAATENGDAGSVGGNMKGGAALQRADRLSRKLQRRITRRTLAEARALRKDTENTLHTLIYFAETLVKDPRAFVDQCRAVWNHLSENEPENQVPPETLEERLALLVREVARRVVHLANYTAAGANSKAVSNAAHHVLKSVRVEGAKVLTFAHSQFGRAHVRQVMGDVNTYTHHLLERLAHLLAVLRSSSHSFVQPFPHAGTNNIATVN